MAIGKNATSNGGVSIGFNADSQNGGIAIGTGAYSPDGEVTIQGNNVLLKVYPDGIYLNGNEIGGNSDDSSGGGSIDMIKFYEYQTKYSKYSQQWEIVEKGDIYYDEVGTVLKYIYDMLNDGNSFYYSLENLEDGGNLFAVTGGERLENFASNIGKMTNCGGMFMGCINLTSFYGNLSSLESAWGMFGYSTENATKLDLRSVQNVADTIPTINYQEIHIGIDSSLQGDSELETALQQIRDKGWTVYEIYSQY